MENGIDESFEDIKFDLVEGTSKTRFNTSSTLSTPEKPSTINALADIEVSVLHPGDDAERELTEEEEEEQLRVEKEVTFFKFL